MESKNKPKMGRKGQVSMGMLLVAFIILVVGLALTPTVANLGTSQSCDASVANCTGSSTTNLTGVSAILFNFVPLFWVILILAIVGVIGFNEWRKFST